MKWGEGLGGCTYEGISIAAPGLTPTFVFGQTRFLLLLLPAWCGWAQFSGIVAARQFGQVETKIVATVVDPPAALLILRGNNSFFFLNK